LIETNKKIPLKHLNEIELLPEDDEITILETGTTMEDDISEDS
jgi:hypothetical protein